MPEEMTLPRTHSKVYLEAILHQPQSSAGTIGSRPAGMLRSASTKSTTSFADAYRPTKSSALAATVKQGVQDDQGEPSSQGNSLESPATYTKALSVSSLDDEGEDPSRHLRISTLQQAAVRRSSDASAASQLAHNVSQVIAILDDVTLDDEDRIEHVRTLLAEKLKDVEGIDVPTARLDNIVLALLHRHREDTHPTGATFPLPSSPSPSPFPASPRSRPRPANLRATTSGAITRPWTPSQPVTPTGASQFSNNDLLGSQPSSPLPMPSSSLNGAANVSPLHSPNPFHRTPTALTASSSLRAPMLNSRPSSPTPGGGSPAWNVAAIEFKPRGAATLSSSLSATHISPSESWPKVQSQSDLRKPSSTRGNDSDDDEFSPFAASESVGALPVLSSSSSSSSSTRLATTKIRPLSGTSGNSSVLSMTTAESISGGSYHGSTTSTSFESSDDPRSVRLLDEADGMAMTPFDVLTSILCGLGGSSTWTAEQIEEALDRNGWDVDATLTAIMEKESNAAEQTPSPKVESKPIPTGPSAARSGVALVSAEVFASQRAGLTGTSPGAGSRHLFGRSPSSGTSPAMSNTALAAQQQQQQQLSRAGLAGGRVCRFFLAGECRRADCRFSHDLNRALCRFWMKGQCLNGDDCSFVHDISLVDSAAKRAISPAIMTPQPQPSLDETGNSTAEEFPELSSAPTAPRAQRNKMAAINAAAAAAASDVNRAKWAQSLQRKWSSPAGQIQQGEPHVMLSAKHSPSIVRSGVPTGPRASNSPGQSPIMKRGLPPRIPLRPPMLMPTLSTGRSAAQMYSAFRESCAVLSEKRNKCLARASEAYKAGNGAEARKWSREGQNVNRALQDESQSSARSIIRNRHDELRVRLSGEPAYGFAEMPSEEGGSRGLRGKAIGNGLGVCLGVVPVRASSNVAGSLGPLSMDERTEALLDCHLLHASEAIDIVEEFLMGLEQEQFRGIAYLAVGVGKHTSTETDRRRVGLAPAIKSFLSSWGYSFTEYEGILAVDPLTHSY